MSLQWMILNLNSLLIDELDKSREVLKKSRDDKFVKATLVPKS